MKWHPYANLFPMLEENELRILSEDIAANGQHHPVIVDDKGLILDGRNRSAACTLAGIQPATKEFKGTDAEKLAFVLSVNLHRRHLDTAQRAMVAEKLATLQHGEKKADTGIPVSPPSQAEAAAMLNVSVDSVQKARKIRKSAAPEVIAAVERGEVSLNAAVETVKPAKPDASHAVTNGKPTEPAETKSLTMRQINHTLLKMSRDKKRHVQIVEIIGITLSRLKDDERCDVLSSQLLKLSPEDLGKVLDDVEQRQQTRTSAK